MIQVNEIRVGNMFIGYDDKPFVWGLKEFSFIEPDVNISIDEIIKSPVVISEEILLKIGFDKKLNAKVIPYDIDKIYRIYSDKNEYELWVLDADYEEIAYCKLCKIKHIHQLQNLYFALTGSELNTSGL